MSQTEPNKQKRAERLAEVYLKAEQQLVEHLETLKNGHQYCDCESTEEVIETVSTGYLIIRQCLYCGGHVTL